MKMIWAIIGSGSVQSAIDALRHIGIEGITRMNVVSVPDQAAAPDNRQQAGDRHDQEMIMVVLADHKVGKAVSAIRTASKMCGNGRTFAQGHTAGRILITYVEEFFTIYPSRKISGRNTP